MSREGLVKEFVDILERDKEEVKRNIDGLYELVKINIEEFLKDFNEVNYNSIYSKDIFIAIAKYLGIVEDYLSVHSELKEELEKYKLVRYIPESLEDKVVKRIEIFRGESVERRDLGMKVIIKYNKVLIIYRVESKLGVFYEIVDGVKDEIVYVVNINTLAIRERNR